jgi:hypothetical protein
LLDAKQLRDLLEAWRELARGKLHPHIDRAEFDFPVDFLAVNVSVKNVFAEEGAELAWVWFVAAYQASIIGIDGWPQVAIALEPEELRDTIGAELDECRQQFGLKLAKRLGVACRLLHELLELVELIDEEVGVAPSDWIDDSHHGPPAMSVGWHTFSKQRGPLFSTPVAANLTSLTTEYPSGEHRGASRRRSAEAAAVAIRLFQR